jgi:hypothetical protein
MKKKNTIGCRTKNYLIYIRGSKKIQGERKEGARKISYLKKKEITH